MVRSGLRVKTGIRVATTPSRTRDVKERGILFSEPMVRALLAGTKTQTRRALKNQSVLIDGGGRPFTQRWDREEEINWRTDVVCPYGVVGDRLRVRETFAFDKSYDRVAPSVVWSGSSVKYAAGGEHVPLGRAVEWGRNRPGIHMPHWASRITLEITEVRVQRLDDLSVKDAIAEGCPKNELGRPGSWYIDLWEKINGAGSWASNPWVWAITFRRIV